MTHGKNICNQLKEVRKRIAEENDIPLETEECTYKGECRGTCPRCEAEVRYLENALADRLRLGKVATVAGLALGLATTTAQAQNEMPEIYIGEPIDSTHQVVSTGVLKGIVTDIKTHEPLPFANVVLKKDGKMVTGNTTDMDGLYTIKPIPSGEYTIEVSYFGYHKFVREGIQVKPTGFTVYDVSLGADTSAAIQGIIIEEEPSRVLDDGAVIGEVEPIKLPGTPANQAVPAIQTGGEEDIMPGNPPFQRFEKEGVKVIVR
jgi:hypothetical protein